MPKALVIYVQSIQSMNTHLGKILKFGVVVLVGILLIEAISRYGFNTPTVWSIELSEFIFGFYFFIAGGYVLLREGHVKMDAFYSRWSPKTRAIADLATFPLLAVYLIVFVWGGISSAEEALRFGQHTPSIWGPPLAPIKIIMVVGAVLLLLQGVAFLIRDLSIIFRGRDVA